MHARRRTGLKHAIGRAADALFAASDSDEALGFVVVGRDLVISYRPVGTQAVAAVGRKVVISEAQRDTAEMISAAAHHARAEPFELRARCHCVRLSGKFPAA